MHVHLPKPLHGWREFVGEIAIIVIGILIALGGDQLVEELHWRHKTGEALAAMRQEIASDYTQAAEAAIVAPCVDRQLVDLEAAIAKPGFVAVPLYKPTAFPAFVVRSPSRLWVDAAWRAAISDATVSHLPPDLRAGLAIFYMQIGTMETNARQSDVLVWRLRALSLPGTPDSRARAIETIEELRGHMDLMALVGNQLMGNADSVDMRPAATDIDLLNKASGTIKFCREHGIVLGKAAPMTPT